MSTFSGFLSISSAFGCNNVKQMLPFQHRADTAVINSNFVPKWISRERMQSFCVERVRQRFAMSRGGNYGLKFSEEYKEDSYWLHLFKESMRCCKVLFDFLIQQPGQLKYIDWPSFSDTLRTASLTLLLVVVLIVALSSIDSALSFVLALLLRKPA
ncbi:hypothetical protein RND81_14G208900 [Saponaria officinalis]|uniref:Uncharacterized protein n=1 Tax=Saponaria officinalis TaxID=3572 RepID=A0AAW1GQH3_SAPOF